MFKLNTLKNPETAIAHRTAEILNKQLKRGRVLWLFAGGSARNYYEEVSSLLDEELNYSNLVISLGDERYDMNPDHDTATWPEFEKLKIFKILKEKGAEVFEILSGGSIEVETERFNALLDRELQSATFILASQGIGKDGHTAGIIPLDNREQFKDTYLEKGFVVGHNQGGEHPNRITISPETLLRVNHILVYATGDDKKDVLRSLLELDRKFPEVEWSQSLHLAPAQYMTVKNAEIFTDQEISV